MNEKFRFPIFRVALYYVAVIFHPTFHPILGSDARVQLEVVKSFDGSDYTLKFKTGTLNVNNFLAKFGIDASQMISSDLQFANNRMGLATLIMQKPIVGGLFSPGGGFEIIATGAIAAPELPADASKFYVIVQDFKEGTSNSANDGYGKPIGAIFALYQSMQQSLLLIFLFNSKLITSFLTFLLSVRSSFSK